MPIWLLPPLMLIAAGGELSPPFVPPSEPHAVTARSAKAEAAMSGRDARKLFTGVRERGQSFRVLLDPRSRESRATGND